MAVTSVFGPVDRADRGAIKAWSALQRHPNLPSTEDAKLVAKRCSMISVDLDSVRGYEAILNAENGDMIVALRGRAASVVVGKVPPPVDLSWFLRNAQGQRVVRTSPNPDLQSLHPDIAASTTKTGRYPELYNGMGSGKTWKQWLASAFDNAIDMMNNVSEVQGIIYNGYWLELMGTNGMFGAPINPDTNKPFTAAAWMDEMGLLGDTFRNYTTVPTGEPAIPNPDKNFVIGHGLREYQSGSAGTATPTMHASQELADHVDCVVMDKFLNDGGGPTDWPTAARLENIINAMIRAQVTQDCFVAVTDRCNVGTWTEAATNRWRRLSAAAFLMGSRGKAMWEFLPGRGMLPWNNDSGEDGELESDDLLYNMNLGRPMPTDSQDFSQTPNPAATLRVPKQSGLYRRRFVNDINSSAVGGIILINTTDHDIVYKADRGYKYLNQPDDAAANFAQGSNITIGGRRAMFLQTTAATDTTPPTLSSLTTDQVLAADQTSIAISGVAADAGVGLDFVQVEGVEVAVDPSTGAFTRTVEFEVGEQRDVVIHAEDAAGNMREAIVRITRPATPAPAVIAITTPTQGQVVAATGTSVTLAGTVTPTGGATIASATYSLDRGPAVTLATPATFSQSVPILAGGPHLIRITIIDSNGQVAVKSVSFSVAFALFPVSNDIPRLLLNAGLAWEVGQQLRIEKGSWDNSPTFTADILRVNAASPETVLATVATAVDPDTFLYTLPATTGVRYRVRINATNGAGTVTKLSDPTPIVQAAPAAAPTNTTIPSMHGDFTVGKRIDFNPGVWNNLGGFYTFDYQLERNDGTDAVPSWTVLDTQDLPYYMLSDFEGGKKLRLGVLATNSAGTPSAARVYSTISAAIAAIAPFLIDAPHTYGAFYQGGDIHVTQPTYGGTEPITVTLHWERALYQVGVPLDSLTWVVVTGATTLDYTTPLEAVGFVYRPVFAATNQEDVLITTGESIGPILSARPEPEELPVVYDPGSFAIRLYNDLQPVAWADPENDYALYKIVGALGWLFQHIEDIVSDDPDTGAPGWSVLFDPVLAPADSLAWMGQFIGVELEQRRADEDALPYYDRQRELIQAAPGFNRGTPSAIEAAARAHLSGARTVTIRERDGSAYRLTVITYTGQTPDINRVATAVRAQKPAGIVLDYHTLTGHDYAFIRDHNPNYTSVLSEWLTYEGMRGDLNTPTTPDEGGGGTGGGGSGFLPGDSNLPGDTNLPGA